MELSEVIYFILLFIKIAPVQNNILDEKESLREVKPMKWPLYVWLAICAVGVFFWIEHWPMGKLMMHIGTGGTIGFMLAQAIISWKRNTITVPMVIVSVVVVLWLIWQFRKRHLSFEWRTWVSLSIIAIIVGVTSLLIYRWRVKSSKGGSL